MDSKKFKKQLSDIPQELYVDIEQLLIKYGVSDVKVTRIRLESTVEVLDKKACENQGRVWHCDVVPGHAPYCRCLKDPDLMVGSKK